MHPIDQRLQALKINLPEAIKPAGHYLPAIQHNDLLFVSGQFPLVGDEMKFKGAVGSVLSEKDGYEASRLATLNALTHIRNCTHEWRKFNKILKVEGHISSAPGWFNQPKVLDGASDLLNEVLGERAGHARTVFAHTWLPKNAAVEIVITAAIYQAC